MHHGSPQRLSGLPTDDGGSNIWATLKHRIPVTPRISRFSSATTRRHSAKAVLLSSGWSSARSRPRQPWRRTSTSGVADDPDLRTYDRPHDRGDEQGPRVAPRGGGNPTPP